MIAVRDAKALFALTTVLVPWDVHAFGQDLGWGLSFSLGRFVTTEVGTQFLILSAVTVSRYSPPRVAKLFTDLQPTV